MEKDEHIRLQEALQLNRPLAAFRSGILAYYDFDHLSTAPLEGADNKMKALRKMASGFRNMEFLELEIKPLHETKHALAG